MGDAQTKLPSDNKRAWLRDNQRKKREL